MQSEKIADEFNLPMRHFFWCTKCLTFQKNPKNNLNKTSSGENYQNNTKSKNNPTEKPHDFDENLHEPYKGYDEKKTSNNPRYESEYDIDEGGTDQRMGEYSDWNKESNRMKNNCK